MGIPARFNLDARRFTMTESIFHKVVRNENSYTQLLCNMMRRDEGFCRRLLTLFAGENPLWRFGGESLSPQTRLRDNCGQPDLIIESPTHCMIVEVKTESHRGCTPKQELLETGRNYLGYLKVKHDSGIEAALTFLVRDKCKFRKEVEEAIVTLHKEGMKKNVSVKLVFWEDVLERLLKGATRTESPLIEDVRLLLAERFSPIRFQPEEIKPMFTPEFPMQTVLKLNAVLEGLRGRAKRDAPTRQDAPKMYSDKEEFGFYFKKGKRELLFVGYWLSFWNAGHPYPICFGVSDDAPKAKGAFKAAFQKAHKKEAISFEEWTMGWVTEIEFNSVDAVDEIWRKLVPIWRKVFDATE